MTKLSRLAAGTMNWGKWKKNLSGNGMAALIATCVENGITTFDHADIYGGYTTEEEFGKAFSLSGVEREHVQIISKCGIQYPSEKRPLRIKHYDYSPAYIRWSVEESLKNLKTEYLDVLLLHRPSPLMQGEEIAEAVELLKAQGKIRAFGVSNFTQSQTDMISRHIKVSYNQIQFSLTEPMAMTDGILDYMQLSGIIPMAWNPLGNVYREDNEQTGRIKRLLAELALKYEVPEDVILIAWILKHPAGIIPVFGTTDPGRIKALAKAPDLVLEIEDWFSLWVESRGTKVP